MEGTNPVLQQKNYYQNRFWHLITVCFNFREEIAGLSQESETQEIQIRSTNEKLSEEINNRKKLEKVLQDAAGALRVVLRVGLLWNFSYLQCTVENQWLQHLWNHENMFKTGVVQANEC